MKAVAEEEGVAPKIIATVDELEAIADSDTANVPSLRGWRRELFGDKALALKNGNLSLVLDRGPLPCGPSPTPDQSSPRRLSNPKAATLAESLIVPSRIMALTSATGKARQIYLAPRPRGWPFRLEILGEENGVSLRRVAVALVQVAEMGHPPGLEACFLAQLGPGELDGIFRRVALPRTLWKFPEPRPDRIAILLHQMDHAALERDDQGEVGFLDDPVDPVRTVASDDLSSRTFIQRFS